MDNEFKTNVCENVQSEIRDVLSKLFELRVNGNLKAYRNLSDSLCRLVSVLDDSIIEERHVSPDGLKTTIRVKLEQLNFIKSLIDSLEVEANSLSKKMSTLLKENDFYNHRDCIISYEKIVVLINDWSKAYESHIKLHK